MIEKSNWHNLSTNSIHGVNQTHLVISMETMFIIIQINRTSSTPGKCSPKLAACCGVLARYTEAQLLLPNPLSEHLFDLRSFIEECAAIRQRELNSSTRLRKTFLPRFRRYQLKKQTRSLKLFLWLVGLPSPPPFHHFNKCHDRLVSEFLLFATRHAHYRHFSYCHYGLPSLKAGVQWGGLLR